MTAIILPFPTRSATIIPIRTTEPIRKPPQSATERAMDTLRNLYVGGLHGHAASLENLRVMSEQHGNPEIMRLAGMALDDLRGRPAVSACGCEQTGAVS